MRCIKYGFVIYLLTILFITFTIQADKLDDLGLDENGKPIQTPEPEKPIGQTIMLRGEYGLTPLQRPELLIQESADIKTKAIAIVEAVIAGPTENEKTEGIKQVFPEGTSLEEVIIEEKNGEIYAKFLIKFPDSFISEPMNIGANFDWITGSIIKSLQELPIVSFEVLARDPKTNDYLPLDKFLPPDTTPEVTPVPDTATPYELYEINKLSPENLYPRTGSGRPVGGLTGKAVYMNPGHGYVWRDSDYWDWQRGFVQNNIEDLSNVDWINQYLFAYCYNAGADVFSVRELDPNSNMVVVDNDDGSPGYVETGTWSNSSLAGYANGHIPYLTGQDPFSYGTNRLALCVVGTPTATATWIPNIPESGWYNVYVSHGAFSNRSPQAHYRIYHSGGYTDYYLDQRMRRFTWIFIGNYYFEAGFNASTGKVVLYNDSTSASHYVSADAVRFGGGRGIVSRGTSGMSGKPRFEEDNRYNLQFSGAPTTVYDSSTTDESDGWSGRPKFGRWLKQQAELYGATAEDSVFVSSHTNAYGSGVHGLDTFVFSGYDGTWHDRLRNYVHDEVLNDLHNGYSTNFVNHGSGKKYGEYGECSPTNVSDLMPIFLGEWIFHDDSLDMNMYHDPKFRQMLARAVYQGIIKFWANEKGSPSTLLPEPPRNFRCRQLSTTSIQLSWDAPLYGGGIIGDAATGYKVYRSTHGRAFGAGTSVGNVTSTTINTLTPGTTYYFYISATNAGGESFPSEELAVKLAIDGDTPKLLIVNGFDKIDKSTRVQVPYGGGTLYRQILFKMNTHDYIVEHAKAIDNYSYPIAFDSCEDEAVELSYVNLADYRAVIWIGGIQAEVFTDDPTVDTSITSAQQTKLNTYLSGGGELFITGAEIAWDLDRFGTTTFVDNVLKANYVKDDADTFSADGLAGSIFEGMSGINFDDGTGSIYKVHWPDVIAPVGGSISAMEYTLVSTLIDDFEDISGWQDPNYSAQTNADATCTFAIVGSAVHQGSGSGDLYYVWGTGNFIREYNSALPEFTADSIFSIWVYGDNSGHQVRICIRDVDNDLFVNNYTTINFTGWQQIVWNLQSDPINLWVQGASGNGTLDGPNVKLDSIQVSKVTSQNSGHIYFDEAVCTPLGGGTGDMAAVQYGGTYKLVYIGFPFETIMSTSTRNEVMKRVLDFFGFKTTTVLNWEMY